MFVFSHQVEDTESQYSVVDMSQLRDKGPEISVVNEEGKRAPLHRVEEELDRHREDANTSRSILEIVSYPPSLTHTHTHSH